MCVDAIQIHVARPVDVGKLKSGVPNGCIKIRKCFGWFGLVWFTWLILLWLIAIKAILNQILMLYNENKKQTRLITMRSKPDYVEFVLLQLF